MRISFIFLGLLSGLFVRAQSPLVWGHIYNQGVNEIINDIAISKDGSILFAGEYHKIRVFYGGTDSVGENMWTGKWDEGFASIGYCIVPLKEETFFLTGVSDYDVSAARCQTFYAWLSKGIVLHGQDLWGAEGTNVFHKAIECSDGAILLGGISTTGNKNLSLARFSPEGKLIDSSSCVYKGYGSIYEFKEEDNGNVIVVGTIGLDTTQAFICEVDRNLKVVWSKKINNPSLYAITSVCIAEDGSYLVSGGGYNTTAVKPESWYAKLDNRGNVIWEKIIKDESRENHSVKVIEYSEGQYMLARNVFDKSLGDNSSKNHDISLLLFNEKGETLWEYTYATPEIEYFCDLELGKDGKILIAGDVLRADSTYDFFIYCFNPPSSPTPLVKEQSNIRHINLYVLDKETNKVIKGAAVTAKYEDGFIITVNTNTEGIAKLHLKKSNRCIIQIDALGYHALSDVVILPAEGVKQENKYYLVREKSGTRIVMKSVRFERSLATLLPDSYTELDKLVQFMKDHPEVKIELSGHTDNGGVAKANQLLSEQRVETVKNYLVSKGISADRITGKGYGGKKPIAPNDTEENKSKNRRVEVKIL